MLQSGDMVTPLEATPTAAGVGAARISLYSPGEELANSATHAVGALLAAVGLVALVAGASRRGDGATLASAVVYGASMLLLYSSSALYHALRAPRAKHLAKILDHASIYLLIAGTYTPVTLITLRNAGGLGLFALVWACALGGIAAEAFWVYRPKWLSAAVYVAMGWLAIFMIKPLVAAMPPVGMRLLVAGGLAYTLGTPFYALKRVPFAHAAWHLFVLGGSVCHFLAIYGPVIPR